MSIKEDQGVLNKYIEGFEPPLLNAIFAQGEPVHFVLCDFGGFQWKVSFQREMENEKWKIDINALNAELASKTSLIETSIEPQTSPMGEVAAVDEREQSLRMRVRVKSCCQTDSTLTRKSNFRVKYNLPLKLIFYPLPPARERATLDVKQASLVLPLREDRNLRFRGGVLYSIKQTNTTYDTFNLTSSLRHPVTSSLKPTPTRIRKFRAQLSTTAATSLLMEAGAKLASLSPLYRTLPSEKCPVDSSRERNRGVSAKHNPQTNTSPYELKTTSSPRHSVTSSLIKRRSHGKH